jgi:peptidoglycan/LPS O-acetylase OafA/YrhL
VQQTAPCSSILNIRFCCIAFAEYKTVNFFKTSCRQYFFPKFREEERFFYFVEMKTPLRPSRTHQTLLLPRELNKNNFDLLRFLLAACVIYSHCFVLFYQKMEDVETLRLLTRNQVDFGGIAVSFFFVISGFLIVRSYAFSTSLRAYFTKRVLRIVPGFAVAFLISVFVLGALGTATAAHPFGNWSTYLSGMSIRRIIWQLFTLEAPRGARTFTSNPLPNMVNESLWTIQYEFLCYLLVPLVGLAGLVKRRWFVLACFLVAYVLFAIKRMKLVDMYAYDNEWNLLLPYPSELPRFFAFFFAGASFYLYRHHIVRSRAITALCVALLGLTAWWGSGLNLALPLAGTYLLFYIAYHPRIRYHNFAKKGDYSYGLYLYGWPVQQLVLYFFATHLNAHSLFLLSFPVTLAAAYFSWHAVEKRFLKMKGRLITGTAPKAAGVPVLVKQ